LFDIVTQSTFIMSVIFGEVLFSPLFVLFVSLFACYRDNSNDFGWNFMKFRKIGTLRPRDELNKFWKVVIMVQVKGLG